MPLKFWDEAFTTATYLSNRLPSKVIQGSTPFELLFHQKPDYNALRTFGCACWPNVRPYNSKKLQFRSKQCTFLGYRTLHKGFKCLDISAGQIYVSRNVVSDENIFPFAKLHPNAGARLWAKILLLPESLRHDGDDHTTGPSDFSPNHNSDSSVMDAAQFSSENLEPNGANSAANGGHFMFEAPGGGHEGDQPAVSDQASPASPSDHAPAVSQATNPPSPSLTASHAPLPHLTPRAPLVGPCAVATCPATDLRAWGEADLPRPCRRQLLRPYLLRLLEDLLCPPDHLRYQLHQSLWRPQLNLQLHNGQQHDSNTVLESPNSILMAPFAMQILCLLMNLQVFEMHLATRRGRVLWRQSFQH
jgi:hypothetical protein